MFTDFSKMAYWLEPAYVGNMTLPFEGYIDKCTYLCTDSAPGFMGHRVECVSSRSLWNLFNKPVPHPSSCPLHTVPTLVEESLHME